jgi:sortase A
MRRTRAIATFFLALIAFLAIGGGAVLLFAPEQSARTVRAGKAPATASPAAQDAPPPAATPADGEYALVPDTPAVPRPGLPNRLVIPSIALDTPVVEVGLVVENGNPAWDTAAFAAGHHRGSAVPGELGNAILAGHISSPVSKKGEVFRRLPEVRIGDRIDVFVDSRRVTYEVAEVRVVAPSAIQVMEPTSDATLTLITCYPDRLYTRRLIVIGKLMQPPA